MMIIEQCLPRYAFSPRDAARAGDVWRVFQEIAIEASNRVGWPPPRYRTEGNAFLVRSMTVVHQQEALYGDVATGRTWISRLRRDMFLTREIELENARGPIARATQEWVHVAASLTPTRAPASILQVFASEHDNGCAIASLPEVARTIEEADVHRFEFRSWITWMDPLGHVNHPAYIDFGDEALSIMMTEAGLDPVLLRPIAEEVRYKSGVLGGERVQLETKLVGVTAQGDAVFQQSIRVDERVCALSTSIRRLVTDGDGDSALVSAFAGKVIT